MTTATKEKQVIKAEVGDNFFEIVDRLFDNSPRTVCAELIQNARRAGATRISFETDTEDDFDGISVRVVDNGRGIDDMADLLRIRSSGWDDGIKRREDPAGMGFFCLCRMNDLLVRSKHSEVDMGHDADALHGRIAVTVDATDEYVEGVELKFLWPNITTNDLRTALDEVGTYAPIMVELNETQVKQHAFRPTGVLDEFENDDVRVYIHRRSYGEPLSFNFHGLVIDADFKNRVEDFAVGVDVKETGKLQMVLPARNALVQNQFYKELMAEIRKRIYSIVADEGTHRLPFSRWEEAQQLGVRLKPAARQLRVVGSRYQYADMATDKKCYVMDASNRRGKFEAVSAAMDLSGTCALYESDSNMVGYQWYDDLEKITNVHYREGDEEISASSMPGTRPGKALAVRCEVNWCQGDTDDIDTSFILPTPILISSGSYGEDSYAKVVARGSGFIIDPSYEWHEDKFCLLIDSAWKATYMNDSQKNDWERKRSLDVRKCLVSPDEALAFALLNSLRDTLSDLPYIETYAGQSVALTVHVDVDGAWSVRRVEE